MYTIGQLSKKTGVTVRTLDYYDEIDLLKPAGASFATMPLLFLSGLFMRDSIRIHQVDSCSCFYIE